ncbi:MAG: SulP family inorganic anion transporter [Bdellovibrionota bacterium]
MGSKPLNLSFETLKSLVPSAFTIAILGAIESLLSAVVADGMTRTRHDPDSELVALGIGNIACPFFGGIPATGAIARTATNIRYGARSPVSSIVHAAFTLVVVLLFAPVVSYLPMAALAALLMLIAYNMSEVKHFVRILRVAPKSDTWVLLLCFSLTVIFDMVVGVTVGILFAAMLFMDRMAGLTSGKFLGVSHAGLERAVPHDTLIYEISGPFFFGAAERAVSAFRHTNKKFHNVIFLMEGVPVMDITGLVAFESLIQDLYHQKAKLFIVGLRTQPASVINRSKFVVSKHIEIADSMESILSSGKLLNK